MRSTHTATLYRNLFCKIVHNANTSINFFVKFEYSTRTHRQGWKKPYIYPRNPLKFLNKKILKDSLLKRCLYKLCSQTKRKDDPSLFSSPLLKCPLPLISTQDTETQWGRHRLWRHNQTDELWSILHSKDLIQISFANFSISKPSQNWTINQASPENQK